MPPVYCLVQLLFFSCKQEGEKIGDSNPRSSDFLLSAFLLMPMPNKTVKKSAWDSVPRTSASHVDLPFGQLDSVIFV
jgi:hypothetical protein